MFLYFGVDLRMASHSSLLPGKRRGEFKLGRIEPSRLPSEHTHFGTVAATHHSLRFAECDLVVVVAYAANGHQRAVHSSNLENRGKLRASTLQVEGLLAVVLHRASVANDELLTRPCSWGCVQLVARRVLVTDDVGH